MFMEKNCDWQGTKAAKRLAMGWVESRIKGDGETGTCTVTTPQTFVVSHGGSWKSSLGLVDKLMGK